MKILPSFLLAASALLLVARATGQSLDAGGLFLIFAASSLLVWPLTGRPSGPRGRAGGLPPRHRRQGRPAVDFPATACATCGAR